MASPVLNSMAALNAPYNTITKAGIREGKVYVYNGEQSPFGKNFTEVVPGVMVDDEITGEYNAGYFNTPITGKDVYVSLHLYGGYLPTARLSKYHVLDPGELPADDIWAYKKVFFDAETTVAELYRNAHCYQYNADADAFLKLPEAGAAQNSLKVYMQKMVMEIGGDAHDRIADLSRVILFLLSKVTLTEAEAELLAPLLAHAQSAVELADVFHREKNIHDYVAMVKADPEGYINGTD